MSELATRPLPGSVDVREATSKDRGTIIPMMVRAFDDDPLLNWMILQDSKRARRIEGYFDHEFQRSIRRGTVLTVGFGLGAAYWFAPTTDRPGFFDSVREMWALMRAFGPGRWEHIERAIFEALGSETRPRWSLVALGVEPELQGEGIGSSLLAPILDECDRTGAPASLISSKARNVPLYERHGFVVQREAQLSDDGPMVWRMWREPQH